jgi:glycosyltransferase involved in cell wall biosynthesis
MLRESAGSAFGLSPEPPRTIERMVGISLLTLVPKRFGGSETATSGLLQALARVGTLDYRVFLPPAAPEASEGLPAEVVPEYRNASSLPERLAAMALATARPGPIRQRLAAADVLHYPFTIRLPSTNAPAVVTLHDLQHLDLPELFSRGERAFRMVAYHRSARSAARVVVPTAFVRDHAVRALGLDTNRVRVIHHGIDHARFTPGTELREPFLLYPARAWPHKNHARLYEALALLRRERPELRLVLTGGGHPREVPDGVEVRGHVREDELVSLYRRAAALVFPSRYEGFGQPPLEAMACGCPVACSAIPALLEVCGDAARTFDADDPAAIAAAVRDVLAEPDHWRRLGLERAAQFTWERAAGEYEAAYRELL